MTLVQVLQRLPLLLIAALGAGAEEQESLTSPNAALVKDLRTGVAPDSSYALPVDVGDVASELLYFWADDGLHGREPWTSDGTAAGLRMLADICPGPCSSQVTSVEATIRHVPFLLESLLVVADDGTAGAQLWSIENNGKLERLTALCVFLDGKVSASCDSTIILSNVILDDGRLLFAVRSSSSSWTGAWATDGTPEGTSRLWEQVDIGNLVFRDFYRAGDWIVFAGYSAALGTEWYRTDGGASLPELIEEVCPGDCPITTASGLQVGERVIFWWFSEPEYRWQTWVTGGTAETTHSLFEGCGDSCPNGRSSLSVVGELAYFLDDSHIWSTDGTIAGTQRLVARPSQLGFLYSRFVSIGSDLALLAGDEEFDGHLWRFKDPHGTSPRLIDLGEVSNSSGQLVSNGDRLLVLPTSSSVADIWLSDGTAAGTLPVSIEDPPGSGRPHPALGHAVGSLFFFTAWRSDIGREIWVSDGMAAGTRPAHDLIGDPAGSSPADFTPLGNQVLFSAEATTQGTEPANHYGRDLWITDGSAGGTMRLFSSLAESEPYREGARDLSALGNLAMFDAENGSDGVEPWITDGTASGTEALGDLNPGIAGSHARDPVWLGNRVFFAAEQGSGEKLWTTDGSAEGTEVWLDIDPSWQNDFYGCQVCSPPGPPGPIFPRDLTVLGSTLLFVAVTPEHGAELWTTDGTVEGTALLLDLAPGPSWSEPTNLTRIDDQVIFLATDESGGVNVWRTDSTPAGTIAIASLSDIFWAWDLHLEDPRFQIVGFEDGSGRFALAFAAFREESRLWIANGSLEELVEIEIPGSAREFTAIRSWLYFTSASSDEGSELWATDGSPMALQQIALRAGIRGSGPRQLVADTDALLFAADDGSRGHELWRLDVDATGAPAALPRLVGDIAIGPASSSPDELYLHPDSAGGRLLFSADDGVHGRELWSLDSDQGNPLCLPDENSLCANGRFRIQAFFELENQPETRAKAVSSTRDTGFFTFFDEDNLELAVKVLDGRAINGHHWLFYGALSNVQYRIVAEDLLTGEHQELQNPRGELCGGADVQAFPEPDFSHSPSPLPAPIFLAPPTASRHGSDALAGFSNSHSESDCEGGPDVLCLQNRFEVSVTWRTESHGNIEVGVGKALPYSDDSGAFWFFEGNNVELVVKMLDGRPVNDRFWFFYGALSDVEYEIRVVDGASGLEKIYHNETGNLCGAADVTAF